MASVHTYRPYAVYARHIYAEAVLDKGTEELYAQNFKRDLDTYEYTSIITFPFLEKQGGNSAQWIGKIAEAALTDPSVANKVVFKLQTYDWGKNVWISEKELNAEVAALRSKGAVNFAYYPEIAFEDKQAMALHKKQKPRSSLIKLK